MPEPYGRVARLVLGTAQLGMTYGVANRRGEPDEATATEIVRAAWECGVRQFDTARAYGRSEAVLGRALAALGIQNDARVVTKTDPQWDGRDAGTLRGHVEESLRRLGVPRLGGLLLHREGQLDGWDSGLGHMLRALISEGLVEMVGVSVYYPEAARKALSLDGIGLVQLPSNVLDRRFEATGVFEAAAQCGVSIHVRSVLLQGLLLLPPHEVPEHLVQARGVVERFQRLAISHGLTPLEAALGFAARAYPVAGVLFGAEGPDQVRANVAAFRSDVPAALLTEARRSFPAVPEGILNPSLWGK